MFPDLKHKKAFLLIRNLVIAELIAYGAFLLLALPFYWAAIYRQFRVSQYVPFNIVELTGLALAQAFIVIFVVLRSLKEKDNIHELLKTGEHERLEFKTTMRWDMKRGQVSKDLERGIMKTIAAFMNSQGGSLIIGIDDQRQVVGLGPDMNSLIKKNHDGFENHFNNVFSTMIGPEFRRHVKLSFHDVGGEHVCLVSVERATRPAYLKTENGEDFFIRTGNATTPLKVSQLASYLADWQNR